MSVRSVTRDVGIEGLADIQFDHYFGAEQDQDVLDDKLHLTEQSELYLPALNMLGMFYSQSSRSAIQACEKKTEYKSISWDARALLTVNPSRIPILRNGKPIVHKKWEKDKRGRLYDADAQLWVDDSLPRVKGVVTGNQAKRRPTLKLPWSMRFSLNVIEIEGSAITIERVEKWLRTGGLMIGIGTHRPVYGRFEVASFATPAKRKKRN